MSGGGDAGLVAGQPSAHPLEVECRRERQDAAVGQRRDDEATVVALRTTVKAANTSKPTLLSDACCDGRAGHGHAQRPGTHLVLERVFERALGLLGDDAAVGPVRLGVL